MSINSIKLGWFNSAELNWTDTDFRRLRIIGGRRSNYVTQGSELHWIFQKKHAEFSTKTRREFFKTPYVFLVKAWLANAILNFSMFFSREACGENGLAPIGGAAGAVAKQWSESGTPQSGECKWISGACTPHAWSAGGIRLLIFLWTFIQNGFSVLKFFFVIHPSNH